MNQPPTEDISPAPAGSKPCWDKAGFLAAILLSLAVGWFLVYPVAINPTNIAWLKGDQAEIYLGWAYFRQDPHWHFPLSFTERLAYPVGAPAAYASTMPLVAVLLKPFSPWLPANFQYLGIYTLITIVLQAVFSYKLCRRFTGDGLLAALGSAFFIISPPLILRMVGHFDLIAHWLVLASLWVYFRPGKSRSLFSKPLWHSLLLLIAGGISPYISLMCLMIAAADAWRGLMAEPAAWVRQILAWGVAPAVLLVSWIVFGFVEIGKHGHDYGGGVYPDASMNLLAPVDPHFELAPSIHSILFPNLPGFPKQYEGYNYLGAGVILLILGVLLFQRQVYRQIAQRIYLPLWVVTVFSFVYALSTRVTLGHVILLDVPLSHVAQVLLSTFRSCGRFFWPGFYFITLFFIQYIITRLQRRVAMGLLIAALCLQIADTRSLHDEVHQALTTNGTYQSVFKDPFWNTLGSHFDKIVVLPSQRPLPRDTSAFAGTTNWYYFGMLAVRQGMTTNVCYMARSRVVDMLAEAKTLTGQVRDGRLDADTIYVLSPYFLAGFIEKNDPAIQCKLVDGMLLCWRDKTPAPGNSPGLMPVFETIFGRKLDLKDVSAGFSFDSPAAVPFAPDAGFAAPEGKGIASAGKWSDIQIAHPAKLAGGSIVIDATPRTGGSFTEQNFSVRLGGAALGDFTLKSRAKITIDIPADIFKGADPAVASLTFDWKNAATDRQLGSRGENFLRAVVFHSIELKPHLPDAASPGAH